jgi:hypothetical protein
MCAPPRHSVKKFIWTDLVGCARARVCERMCASLERAKVAKAPRRTEIGEKGGDTYGLELVQLRIWLVRCLVRASLFELN